MADNAELELANITVCYWRCRMTAQLSADSELGDDLPGGRTTGARSDSLSGAAKRTTRLHLPGMSQSNTRSLFIFSEDNFIRKYAQIIIEWGYPLSLEPFTLSSISTQPPALRGTGNE